MAKRIFRNMVFAAVLAVLLTAMLIVPALYNAHEESMSRELRREADGIACALPLTDDIPSFLEKFPTDSRVTLIAQDGRVIFDSMADAGQMENHAERPEILQAFASGSGASTRTSETLSETTLYYARRMDDGAVLRVGNTRRSMLGTFINVLPLMAAMLLCVSLLSLLLARKAAGRIVAPINALDLDDPLANDAYDELAPLLTRMHHQHTQLQQQMQALEGARTELAAIMANMREGMILLDKNETVLSMNGSAAHIFGVTAEGALGQKLLSVNRDTELHDLVQQALRGEGGSLCLKRGDHRYDLYVSPVMKENAVRGTVLLILDVTERLAAEESRREFTANVSHELKTPLTSISGFAEIIRDGIAQPQDIEHFADMICKESTRMIALINDILELSRLDERQHLGRKEPVALLPMLRELTEDFTLAARKKGLTIRLSGDDATIRGYPVLLREMFFNLMDNAVKYTPEGGEVAVSLYTEGERMVCCVSDNGIGIPPEHQAHVFERFYRVDKSHSRQTGGTGLGLAIVKHAAQIHKAQIRLQSAVGKGTKIEVIFSSADEK